MSSILEDAVTVSVTLKDPEDIINDLQELGFSMEDMESTFEAISAKVASQADTDPLEDIDITETEHKFLIGLYLAANNLIV